MDGCILESLLLLRRYKYLYWLLLDLDRAAKGAQRIHALRDVRRGAPRLGGADPHVDGDDKEARHGALDLSARHAARRSAGPLRREQIYPQTARTRGHTSFGGPTQR